MNPVALQFIALSSEAVTFPSDSMHTITAERKYGLATFANAMEIVTYQKYNIMQGMNFVR